MYIPFIFLIFFVLNVFGNSSVTLTTRKSADTTGAKAEATVTVAQVSTVSAGGIMLSITDSSTISTMNSSSADPTTPKVSSSTFTPEEVEVMLPEEATTDTAMTTLTQVDNRIIARNASKESLQHKDVYESYQIENYYPCFSVLGAGTTRGTKHPIPVEKTNVSWHQLKVPFTGVNLTIGYVKDDQFQDENCIELRIPSYKWDQNTVFEFDGTLSLCNGNGPSLTVKFLSTETFLYVKTTHNMLTVFTHNDKITIDLPESTESSRLSMTAIVEDLGGEKIPFFSEQSSYSKNLRHQLLSSNSEIKESEKAKVRSYNSQEYKPYNHKIVFGFNFFALLWAFTMRFLVSTVLNYRFPRLSKFFRMPDKADSRVLTVEKIAIDPSAPRHQPSSTPQPTPTATTGPSGTTGVSPTPTQA